MRARKAVGFRSSWSFGRLLSDACTGPKCSYLAFVIAETIPALRSLSSDQKILLAAELWRDAVGADVEIPSPVLVKALRERLDFYHEHPDQVSTWEQVRSRIASRKTL